MRRRSQFGDDGPMFLLQAHTYTAPWWGTAAIGVVGVLAGIAVKAMLDLWSGRRANRREDYLRFIGDKRRIYSDFLAACTDVADVEHDGRKMVRRSRALDEVPRPSDSQLDEYDADHETNKLRRVEAYRNLNEASSALDLVAPPDVVQAAAQYQSRTHHPHLLPERVEAETRFIDLARAEFGYPPIGGTQGFSYEDYIPWDDPRSEIEPL